MAGTIVHVDNRYLAVWVRERGAWKFVAYQPTPIINRELDAPRVASMGAAEANGPAPRSWYLPPHSPLEVFPALRGADRAFEPIA